ncbi:hypothetical protein BESB_030540 [Besnoitia besnoiti]|uniref:Transmembrane protein n=1 Tax=Besnoitia besnoiti TaxID=94643 RepID=A0A2A9M6Z5_BESBE|nr:hypothetical protein BESB_030540 [Besnoitia besnoiti]PFH31180.1 hypothetical protein BESB_030540 [Besnoitia besnoiti]
MLERSADAGSSAGRPRPVTRRRPFFRARPFCVMLVVCGAHLALFCQQGACSEGLKASTSAREQPGSLSVQTRARARLRVTPPAALDEKTRRSPVVLSKPPGLDDTVETREERRTDGTATEPGAGDSHVADASNSKGRNHSGQDLEFFSRDRRRFKLFKSLGKLAFAVGLVSAGLVLARDSESMWGVSFGLGLGLWGTGKTLSATGNVIKTGFRMIRTANADRKVKLLAKKKADEERRRQLLKQDASDE